MAKKKRKAAAGQGRPQRKRRGDTHRVHSTARKARPSSSGSPNSKLPLEAAQADLARGWYSVPIPAGEKAPRMRGWQNLRLDAAALAVHFAGDCNRGLLLGEPSGGLVDIDLDAAEAVALAESFLPETDRIHGRLGKPRSHWWFVADLKTAKFQDVDNAMLVEIRSTGGQTVVPPSTHPTGERLAWHTEGDPAEADPDELQCAVARLAAAALLVRHYPEEGGRHDLALALAGALLRGGMEQDTAAHFIEAVAVQARDNEVADRVLAVGTTAEQLARGGETTGLPRLTELLGDEVAKRLAKWLGIRQNRRSAARREPPSLEEARAVVAAFQQAVSATAAKSAKSADLADSVAKGLRCEQTVGALATLSEHAPAEFAALLLHLVGNGIPVRIVDRVERAVRQIVDAHRRAADTDPSGEGDRYFATANGLYWRKRREDDVEVVQLTNFPARITEEVAEDDGAEVRRAFRIEVDFRGRVLRFLVPAPEFESLGWVLKHVGAQAIVYPNHQAHARVAMQTVSDNVDLRTVYQHLGWTTIDEHFVFLHAGGGIGGDGPVAGLEVIADGELANYLLPEPRAGKDLRHCIRESLRLLSLAPQWITWSLMAGTFRAPLGIPFDAALFLTGRTGVGKSELAARFQQFFGPRMDRATLPASWASTGNALELLAFRAKDTMMVVDDFCPTGGQGAVTKYHGNADRLLRAQRNKAGRQRMYADGTLRPTRYPQCVLIGTGEDVPYGHSLRASFLVLLVSPQDVDFKLLTEMQRLGQDGVFANVMAAYIKWLAPRLSRIQATGRARIDRWRARAAGSELHRRTPEIIANLAIGVSSFLSFARQSRAITKVESREMFRAAWKALGEAARQQAEYHKAAEPERRFLELIAAALSSGQAHLAGVQGNAPHVDCKGSRKDKVEHPRRIEALSIAHGWRRTNKGWQPQGMCIGWIGENGEIFLAPDVSYKAAQEMARGAEGISIAAKTLHKRLHEAGQLATIDPKRKKLTVRRTLQGSVHNVLHVRGPLQPKD